VANGDWDEVKMIRLREKIVGRDARYGADYHIFPVYVIEDALGENGLTYEPYSVKMIEKISKGIEYIEDISIGTRNQTWAYCQILRNDLLTWLDVCRQKKWESDIDERLPELNKEAINEIRSYLELRYESPYQLYMRDKLPRPFEDCEWDALNVRPKFHPDIPVGIYFSKEKLTEYSKVTLYHEHLHVAITPEDGDFHFVAWFDEGVCDVIAHILAAKKFDDCTSQLEMMMRKYTIDDLEYRVRGWNAKTVAQLVLNYGLNFLRYLIQKRREEPKDIDWTRLYDVVRRGGKGGDLRNCFRGEIPRKILDDLGNPSLDDEEQFVCKRIISYQLPVVISALAYWGLQRFLDCTETGKAEFAFLRYEEILGCYGAIDMSTFKEACLELNGLLCVSAEKTGIRSWDTVGYYKDILDYEFVKVKGMEIQNINRDV